MEVMESLGQFIGNVGFPTAFVMLNAWFVWKLFPELQALVEGHLSFLATVAASVDSISKAIQAQELSMRRITDYLTERQGYEAGYAQGTEDAESPVRSGTETAGE